MRQLSLIFILTGLAFAAPPRFGEVAPQRSSGYSLLTEVTDDPAVWWLVWWTGVGNVSDFLVSNTMQGGVFARHPDDEHEYQGLPAYTDWYPGTRGRNAEYPAGSEQYYLYCMGFWFGAMYPAEIDGADTTWKANVSKAAYCSDMGAMAVPEMMNAGGMRNISGRGLYFSDMTIPEGFGFEGEGNRLFAYPDEVPESYQIRWPFVDSFTINPRRRAAGLPEVSPQDGDVVSHQDTYATGGDWIPVDDATTIWIPPGTVDVYDNQGLGIRVEQRSYSWKRGALANVIVLNYKIRNMNEYALEAPYFGYFADPDIGSNMDDVADFDASRGLGYAYDFDGYEAGWSTPAGYIGVILLDTPGDVGATGFEAWPKDSAADYFTDWCQDSLKYEHLKATDFESWKDPEDVRILIKSGPYPDMNPDDEYDFTLAVVVGETLEELQANVDSVRAAFQKGFPWIDTSGIAEERTYTEPIELNFTAANISNYAVNLSYILSHTSDISLAVYDPTGRKIEMLYQGQAPAGTSEFTWDASDIPAGVYFIRLSASGQSCTERVLIVK